jgi:hypothetical protein
MTAAFNVDELLAQLDSGELVLRAPSAFARRDALIRETYHLFFAETHQPAKTMSDRLRRYARTAWPREAALTSCPRVGSTPERQFWQILKLVPRELSADRIEKIVS